MSSPQEKAIPRSVSDLALAVKSPKSSLFSYPIELLASFCFAPLALALLMPVLALGQGAAPPKIEEQAAALNSLYQKSMESFGKGEFKDCVAGLREMLAKGAEGPGTESVYFTIAAALFNLKQYKEAKAAFEEYNTKYPAGTKLMEAQTGIGQCQMALGDKEGAVKTFADMAQKPGANKEKMLLVQANLLKEMKKTDQALALLRPAVTGVLGSEESVQLVSLLASLEVSAGDAEAAFKLLNLLYRRFDVVDNPLQVNGLAFEIGDALLNKKDFKQALRSYSLVRRKDDVLALQRQKLQMLASRYDSNLAAIKQTPDKLSQLQSSLVDLKAQFEEGKKVLEEVEKADDYMMPLRFRQARAYQELKRPWGTIVLMESLLKGDVKGQAREDMMFSICGSQSDLNNIKGLNQALDAYLKEFPKGKYANEANHMRAVQLLQSDDLRGAETLFGAAIKNNTAGERREFTLFLLANIRFGLSEWDKALEAYADYSKSYPKGEHLEEVAYRSSLSHFFKGDYEKALAGLEAYLKGHPDGTFVPDAGYRVAACYMAAQRAKDVIARCQAWAKNYGYHPLMSEVMSLLGDAYASLDKREEAADAYFRGLQLNATDEVLNYLLFEANKQYQKLGQWNKSTELFKNFIERNPKHPAVVASMFWLSKALVKEGKPEEAKRFLADKIATFIKNRESDAVEQLLTQLAQLCAKKPRPPVKPTPVPGETQSVPAPAAEPPPYDPEAELDKYLPMKTIGTTDLARGRIFYARAELARMTRRPKDAADWMDRLCKEIGARDLGAALLAQAGDRMLERNEKAKATAFYKELMTSFPKSEFLDFAYNGLGQIALIEGKNDEAFKWFDDAVEKVGANARLKDVTLGKGKALLAKGKFEEAKAIFEQVGATREWRGAVTAESLFLLGETAFRKQEYAVGLPHFQRVAVAYTRYPSIVARAYLRAADCFEKMGDAEKAKAQLAELLAKEKLAGLPEVEVGRKRLEAAQ
jgi:TolA-binding protein